jgi:hypothetical protein
MAMAQALTKHFSISDFLQFLFGGFLFEENPHLGLQIIDIVQTARIGHGLQVDDLLGTPILLKYSAIV